MSLVFEPIELQRQKDYCRHFSQCDQQASDYSFANLWGWADEYQLQWAWHEELVWIKQSTPIEVLWAPVGAWHSANWPAALAMARQVCPRIIRVPELLFNQWQTSAIAPHQTQESRQHWDYLYTLEDLSRLSGNRYHKKKNLVNQFKKKYDYTYLPFSPEMVAQALAMQTHWCTWRDCESHDTLAAENRVIAKVLNNYHAFEHITGGALRVDKTLVAYTIAETLPDTTLLIHFEKGDPDYKGSYQAINQLFLENAPAGHPRVNREQDLGDEGLRKAKLSYHPVDYVRKFEVIF
jgi:uncharacterized protein